MSDRILPGCDLRLAYWAQRRRERHLGTPDLLPAPAKGILIHSGSTGTGTAQWAWRSEARFWAHFAWDSARGLYVQTDYLDAWAPHGGALNQHAIGIETPHHPGAGDEHKQATIDLVSALAERGAEWITGHRFGDHNKRDPGAVVTADWWDGLGLRCYWTWQGEGWGALLADENVRPDFAAGQDALKVEAPDGSGSERA